MPLSALHPPSEQLVAFGLGQLAAPEAAALETHLRECERCCSHLDRLPADGLIKALRGAVRPAAADSWAGAAQPSAAGPDPADLPPALEGHPRYRVTAPVGRGGMGAVYRAEHTLMGRTVALKVIAPQLLKHPAALARFRQEVTAAARLSHPNIVIAYDAEQAGGYHFLVMEFVEGTNLADHLRQRGRLDADEACACVRQAALGLQHAFERGMVHRDVKPQNLMLTADGQVKVLDFGLARFVFEQFQEEAVCNVQDDTPLPGAGGTGSGLTGAGSMMGTLDYMAPEQARDARRADIRADIYSLGCTLYQLLTGQVPFPGGDACSKAVRLVAATPVPLARLRPDLPNGLAELVARMMAPRPEDRPQTPAEVAAALAPFAAAASQPGKGDEVPRTERRPRRWSALAASLTLALAVLAGGAAVLQVQPAPDDGATAADDPITKLIRQLGDGKFAKRETASKALEALGAAALPALRKATGSDDPEIRRRADALIPAISHRIARTDVKSEPPPKGAVVLFDGKNLDAWVGGDGVSAPSWKLLDGGVMEAHAADIRTRRTFAEPYKLHVEFRIPPDPPDTPVGRGNSGVYLHGNYEVQILDSYGPDATNPKRIHSAPAESCGAVFGQTAPRVNACNAPGFWQSYDIEFHPPRFEGGDGVKFLPQPPRVTVFHNGALIHDNVPIRLEGTGSMGLKGDLAQPGPVMLQYHQSPVQFRNIWLVPLKPVPAAGADAEEVKRLIRQLGSPKFKEREAAERRLEAVGEPALEALRKAAEDTAAEVRVRAARLVEAIDGRLPYFFNGRNLKRWQGLNQYWTVRDGSLVGSTPDGLKFNTFLCSEKTYRDFELRFEVRVAGKGWAGNSGVQIRSEVMDREKWVVHGPQCDIGEGCWGSLWGEGFGRMMKEARRDVVARVLKPEGFNDYHIKCVGKRVTIKLNGQTTVDAEIPELPAEGVIAWQLLGGEPMTVTFRKIAFKDLSKK